MHGLPSSQLALPPQFAHWLVPLQKALTHWNAVAAVHAVPMAFFAVQLPPARFEQYWFVAQLACAVHAVQTGGLPAQKPEVHAALEVHAAPFPLSAAAT